MFTNRQKRTLLAFGLAAAWLYTFSLLYQMFVTNNDNPRKIINQLESYISSAEDDFYKECKDAPTIFRLFYKDTGRKQHYDISLLDRFRKKPYAFFVYQNRLEGEYELRFWSANYAFPSPEHFLLPSEFGHALTLGNGIFEFCRKNMKINGNYITVACLIPLRWEYFMENEYLKKRFAISGIERKYETSPEPTIYPVKNRDGRIMMYLREKKDERNTGYSMFVIITRYLSLAIILGMIYYIASIQAKRRNAWFGLGILLAGFLVLRIVTLFFPFPFDTSRLEIFDPRIYASGSIFSSLGDLIFIVILFFLSVQFLIHHRPAPDGTPAKEEPPVKSGLLLLLLVVCTFTCSWMIRSIIADSKISFNVTNFFSLNQFSLLGFLVVALIVLSFYYLSGYILQQVWDRFPNQYYPYIITAVGGLVLLYLRIPIFNYGENVFVLAWLMIYMLFTRTLHISQQNRRTALRTDVLMLLFFSVSVGVLFTRENNDKELSERKVLAEKMAFRSDPSTENLLNIALSRFNNNFLNSEMQRWSDPVTGKAYKDSLSNQNFVGYLNKFDTKIYTYDSLAQPVNNDDSTSLRGLENIVETSGNRISNISDLYYYEQGFDQYSYIFYKKIQDTAYRTLGYFVVDARPSKYRVKSDPVNLELFRNRADNFYERINNYVYAVYYKNELRKRFIDYDLPLVIQSQPVHDDTIIRRNGYEELWHRANSDLLVVIGKKNTLFISSVTLFAYLFFTFLFVTLLFRLFKYLLGNSPRQWWNQRLFQLSIRNQVQGIIIVASLLSFVVIGFTIISLFSDRFDKNNRDRLSRAMSILVADVENKVAAQSMFDDVVKIYEAGANPQLEEAIYQMSEIHNVDFNIYGLDGTLALSSQPYVRNREIVGNKMDAKAYYNMSMRNSGQFVQQEKIGSFSYLSMYVPVRDANGEAYAYLNIPYYASRSDLTQEISNFLVTIINLNAFIFLIAGLISSLVTSRITRSFLLIGEKMKEVNLGRNEVITWKRNDELGELVNKYNEMVLKLEASATKLAKSEREGAWREMARQVAHEIKNPLTPMKLSIQFLQKSINHGAANVKELTASVTQTLVEQIDHLSKIAADFSQFANISNAKLEPIPVHEMLVKIADLFSVEPGAVITVADGGEDLVIKADKTQINRLFTNLVKNALQAYDEEAKKPIDLGVTLAGGQFAVISVRDHGTGIPEDVRGKIFTPNFTTKTSGTGLGLAISKGIAEQAGGEIWFDTGNGGTTFFVQLPLLK